MPKIPNQTLATRLEFNLPGQFARLHACVSWVVSVQFNPLLDGGGLVQVRVLI